MFIIDSIFVVKNDSQNWRKDEIRLWNDVNKIDQNRNLQRVSKAKQVSLEKYYVDIWYKRKTNVEVQKVSHALLLFCRRPLFAHSSAIR